MQPQSRLFYGVALRWQGMHSHNPSTSLQMDCKQFPTVVAVDKDCLMSGQFGGAAFQLFSSVIVISHQLHPTFVKQCTDAIHL